MHAAHMANFLLENVQAVNSQFSSKEISVLSNLFTDISNGFDETDVGKNNKEKKNA